MACKIRNRSLSSKKTFGWGYKTLDVATFHTQQCAEKALKGFLVYKNKRFPKVHDLELLVKLWVKFNCEFQQLFEYAKNLTPYCVEFRYPHDIEFQHELVPTKQEVEQAIIQAETILNFIRNKLSSISKA